jgi:predicted O-methyltransferase YrrM
MVERGAKLPKTSVTANQLDLLLKAVAETEPLGTAIAEVGCFNGATTRSLALQTARDIYAIDPYVNPKNSEKAMANFREATGAMPHVKHLRQSSGDAARTLAGRQLGFVFIDAVHDYMNTWFDFVVWGDLLQVGGCIAFHDADDWRGTNVACQKILKHRKDYEPWGYCPNLLIFRKVKSD